MNEQSEHLSNAQIENYGDRTSGAGPDADQHREAERVEAHLDGCPSCRSRLLDLQRTDFGLLADPKFVSAQGAGQNDTNRKLTDNGLADSKQAAPKLANPNIGYPKLADGKFADTKQSDPKQLTDRPVNKASTPDCPSEDGLRQLAAALLPDSISDELTRHASTCDHCGPLLRTYTEDFSDDVSQGEQAVLAKLQSSSASWQKKTAREMISAAGISTSGIAATTSARPSSVLPVPKTTRGFFWKWALVPAAAAACAAVAFGIWYTQRDTPEKVEKLLAQAYTERRTMEPRFPGAGWGPTVGTRGSESASASLPLLQAEEILARQHAKSRNDLGWIRARAENEILAGDIKQAITDLNLALQTYPDSILLKQYLAIAYYQQGQQSQNQQDYKNSILLLTAVLRQDSTNGVALFNLALASEQLDRYPTDDPSPLALIHPGNGSIQTEENWKASLWKAFLQANSDQQWAAEARRRLENLSKLK